MANKPSGPIVAIDIDVGKARDAMLAVERALNDRAIDTAMRAEVTQVLEDARANCPTDTGALRDSLGIRKRRYASGRILWYAVGPRRKMFRNKKTGEFPSRYAHLVEFGVVTRGIPARPFLRSAFDKAVPTFGNRVQARLNALLRNP